MERRYMGIWTLTVTLGVPVGPLIFGFVTNRTGYRWIFWALAIFNGAQFILYLFGLRPVTFPATRTNPTPLKLSEFYHPLTLFLRPAVAIPAFAYAMVFLFGSVLITVEVPQLLQQKFNLNAEQLGLQFLGVIIGTILGEQIGGSASDIWMARRARRLHSPKPGPEFRLWLSYPGVILTIIGVVIFLVAPIVGTGVAAIGNQLVTTVLVTYAVDSYPEDSGSVGVFVTFVRQIWGFIGPFWFPDMFNNVGIAASSGIAGGLMFVFSFLLVMPVHVLGSKWRG
ncbi:MFS general substrate transporter [Aspergillus crustosus]